jgi:para-aminobenzoate synthetase/4-amino-4-deoxychorismate lyase
MRDPPQVAFCQYSGSAQPTWLWFEDLVQVVETWQRAEVLDKLDVVEQAVLGGLYAAGFVSYEAAPAMDAALCTHPGGELPLVWFGLFRRMAQASEAPAEEKGDRSNLCQAPGGPLRGKLDPSPFSAREAAGFSVGPWQPSVTPEHYAASLDRVHDYIARGHTYQVNYTFRLRARFGGDAWNFFRRLAAAQRGQYGAYIDTGRQVLCSASPELFLRLDGDTLLTRPMKGTCARGLTSVEDRQRRSALAESPKDRAENAMIVDMMRNDLGRIAARGSVQVVSAFDLEKYPTVYQMTSSVACRTSAPLAEIMRAVFPCASVTGAPKVRTMQIIRELEADARGVYTGSIGWLAPGRKARLSVAIRTVSIDRAAGTAEYGVGGGIVWDSDKAGEYAECATKAAVLTSEVPPLELLETLLYDGAGGYFLLEEHLRRLAESADYFDFAVDLPEVRRRLAGLAGGLPAGAHRVRLLVDRGGRIVLESAPSPAPSPGPWRLRLADRPISSGSVFLYHKTTCRGVYEAARAAGENCDDVVLYNEHGQVTETTIANLVVEKDGQLVTPPVACGLLPGVFRGHLLQTGQVGEEIVSLDDLRRRPRLFAVNSLRKWLPAVLVG